MAGRLARDAPHLDGSESIGVWFDVAWATYADLVRELDKPTLDHIDEVWDDILAEHDITQPTMETWGSSQRAQEGQAALMAMLGGTPGGDGGAFPDLGEG